MICITYKRDDHHVSVIGHAGSDKPGQDPVCAGVSALVYTLAANVDDLVTKGSARDQVLSLQSGFAEVGCTGMTGMDSVVTLIFDTVCTGFEMLSLRYPEYVHFHVK